MADPSCREATIPMFQTSKTFAAFASVALVAALSPAQAGAQAADIPTTCNGLEATQIVTEIDEADVGTQGDDVIVIAIDVPDDLPFSELPLFLALGGDDTICISGSGYGLSVLAGAGDDIVFADTSIAYLDLSLGSGNDTATIQSASWTSLSGGPGDDEITGGRYNDSIDGGPGTDILRGGAGDDDIIAGEGNDEVYGGRGHDWLEGGEGDDRIVGFEGDDFIIGGTGKDELHGGPGNDVLASVDPWQMPHQPSFVEDTAGDRMFGGVGDDRLVGGDRWDRMQGGPGNDVLLGFEGRDFMRGGSGNDELIGGTNVDDMNGNTGADRLFLRGDDVASGGLGRDTCGGFSWDDVDVPTTCETEFSTTMAMVNMNMANGAID